MYNEHDIEGIRGWCLMVMICTTIMYLPLAAALLWDHMLHTLFTVSFIAACIWVEHFILYKLLAQRKKG